MNYSDEQRKQDRSRGLAALSVASISPGVEIASNIKQYRNPNTLREALQAIDGDAAIRARMGTSWYEQEAWDALRQASKNQDTSIAKLPEFMPANSFAIPPNKQFTGGHVLSGVPSRAVLAHELGHITRFKDPRNVRRFKALKYGATLAPLTYFAGTKLGLSDEQALAGSTAITAGVGALNMRNVLKEEFYASRNALKTLRAYNKTLKDAADRVNIRSAKNTLKYALGTYKKGAIPVVALASLGPAAMYGAHKLYKSKKEN